MAAHYTTVLKSLYFAKGLCTLPRGIAFCD